MENQQLLDQTTFLHTYDEADLQALFVYFEQGMGDRSIKNKLIKKGYDESTAEQLLYEARKLYREVIRKKAMRDIIFGALWFFGGTVATLAHVGFIFWGAIVFGLIQCIRGIVNYSK